MMAVVIEAAGRPVHTSLIVERTLAMDAKRKPSRVYNGKTPGATMSAQLATSNKNEGTFIRTEPGVYGLRAWPKSKLGKKAED